MPRKDNKQKGLGSSARVIWGEKRLVDKKGLGLQMRREKVDVSAK